MVKNLERCIAGGVSVLALVLMSCLVFSCKSSSDNKEKEEAEQTELTVDNEVVDSIATDSLSNFADYDFVYFRGSNIYFYSVANMDSAVYEKETYEIVNYTFKPGTLMLYYSVCMDSMMELKCINFASENPEPQKIVSWGLTCKDCITETYGTYSSLSLSDDGRYIGVNHDFSWDGYGFREIKVYDLEINKFVKSNDKENMYDYFNTPYVDEEEDVNEEITYNSFFEAGSDDDDDESEESSYNYYYGSKEKGGVCLSDRMKFESMPEEFELHGISPKGDRVVFGAVLGWGDFPHGPYCIASLDGKLQAILDGTDLSYNDGPSMGWLDNGTLLYVANFMADVEDFVPTVMAFPADGKKPVELVKATEFIMLPK